VFVIKINDFLSKQLALEHIFDGQLFAVLDAGDDLFESLGLENGVWLDDGDGEGEIDLLGIE